MRGLFIFSLKVLIVWAFIYAIIQVITDGLIFDGHVQIVQTVMASVISGLIMSVLFVLVYFFRLKRAGLNIIDNDDVFKTRQKKTIEIEISVNELINRLKTDKKTGRMQLELKNDIICLDSGGTIWDWGTEYEIQINKSESDLKKITVKGKPALFTTLFDFGQCFLTVLYIENLIKEPNRHDNK